MINRLSDKPSIRLRPARRGTCAVVGILSILTMSSCSRLEGNGLPTSTGPVSSQNGAGTAGQISALNSGFLSDQLGALIAVPLNGWGLMERDRANGDDAEKDGPPLRLSGVTFAKGLGVHAASDVVFNLSKSCSRFRASIGVDDSVRAGGQYDAQGRTSIEFEVYAGGQKMFSSGVMTAKSATQIVDVALPIDAKTLRLVVTDGGDSNSYDHGDWALARVECGSSSVA